MKLEIFKEKVSDVISISQKRLLYFRLKSGKVIKTDAVEANFFNQGIFQKENLEKALSVLIKKHKLTVLGIILHWPNIIYQRITLPRNPNPYEAILNYLKVSFPLSLERYTFFYKEDKYELSPTISNYNLFFIPKEIIDNLLVIIEKKNLVPLFISPSLEVIYQYFLAKSIIDFSGEYMIFYLDNDLLIVFLVKKLRIEKMLIEEIDFEKTNLNLIMARFYNFLKTNVGSEAKVLIFSEKEINQFSEISHPQIIFVKKPLEIFAEGSKLIFEKVFTDKEFIDFLPIKSYSAYFLNRLPSIIAFLTVYLVAAFFIVSSIFLIFNFSFHNQIKNLNREITTIKSPSTEVLTQFDQLLAIKEKFNPQILENFGKIKKITALSGFEKVDFQDFQKLSFSLKISKKDLEKIRFSVSRLFPEVKLIQEENISDEEVRLNYSF